MKWVDIHIKKNISSDLWDNYDNSIIITRPQNEFEVNSKDLSQLSIKIKDYFP